MPQLAELAVEQCNIHAAMSPHLQEVWQAGSTSWNIGIGSVHTVGLRIAAVAAPEAERQPDHCSTVAQAYMAADNLLRGRVGNAIPWGSMGLCSSWHSVRQPQTLFVSWNHPGELRFGTVGEYRTSPVWLSPVVCDADFEGHEEQGSGEGGCLYILTI